MKKNEKPGTVLFRTGDIARILNMSSSGVLFYDRKGVVSAARGENGYRGFDANALSTLGLLRAFERAGFTLEEANTLFQKDASNAKEALIAKRAQLMENIELIDMILGRMDMTGAMDERFEREKARLETSPEFCYAPYWEECFEMDAVTPEERRQMREVDISWLAAMPIVRYCGKIRLEGGVQLSEKGMIVTREMALKRRLALPPLVERIPEQRCLHFFYKGDQQKAIDEAVQALAQEGLCCAGPMLTIIQHIRRMDMTTKMRFNEYWIPVKEIC